MRTLIALLLFVGFLFTPACTPTDANEAGGTASSTESELAERMDTYLSEFEELGFRGAVLAAREGEIILEKGYGLANDSTAAPITPQTVFTIGSITKQFTAAAILKLEEAGKLSIQDSLIRFFPDVPAGKQAITLHQLLTHSAGFPSAIGDDFDPVDAATFLRLAFQAPLQFRPGAAYQYSNVGYSILGIIIEKISGHTYETYLRQELFLPAGMQHTGYQLPDWEGSSLAQGYRRGEHWGTIRERPWLEDGPGWHLRANGGILSTAQDMYRWHQALQDDKILSDESKAKYFAPHVREGEGAPSFYGYGWAIMKTPRQTKLITHNGGNGIFFADLLRYPEENVFIFLACSEIQRGIQDAAHELARMIFQPDFTPQVPEPRKGKELALLPDTPNGQTARALLDLLQSGDANPVSSFIENHFSEQMLSMAPMEQHVQIFSRLQTDLADASLHKIMAYDNSLELFLKQPSGELWLLQCQFSEEDPSLLAGLGIDMI